MSLLRFEAPLKWPDGVPETPRTQQKSDHGFPATELTESIGFLEDELKAIIVSNAVLSLDIEQPTTRLRKKVGSRTGASLQMKYQGRNYVLACDRWINPEHNIYAMHLALRQWRNMERWGVGSLPALLHGFQTDQAGHTAGDGRSFEPWMESLGLGPSATIDDAVAVYHRRAKTISADPVMLRELNLVMEAARAYFAKKGPL